MAIYYLDVDDEITSAAARIRDSADSRLALVLSGGSRVATSRINFRLLALEAKHRHKRLAIIAADPSVQSVARTAELAVYTTVAEYERAEAAIARGLHGRSPNDVSDALDELALTVAPAEGANRPGGTGMTRIAGSSPANGGPKRRVRISRALVVGVTMLVVAVVGAAAFFFYPSANVVLTLREDSVGKMTVSVKVDPSVVAANDQTGTVPGLSKAFAVDASGTFDATGQNVVDTAATGTVTFVSLNTYLAVPVLAGTRVSTAGGIAFTTASTVTVPKATVSGTTITRGTAEAPIVAVNKGLSGNVAANAIVNVPTDLASALVASHPVGNANATTGGTHTVTPQIQQSDIDKAEASLLADLDSSFQADVRSAAAATSGPTLFTGSAHLGAAVCSPDPQGLLNQAVASFQLDCQGTGTATTADLTTATTLAERRVRAAVRTGYSIVGNSVTSSLGTAAAGGTTVVVPVTVQAVEVPIVDVAQLRAAVKGKSLDDARSILSSYGQAEISVSPDWATTMPSFDFRIDIQVVVPSQGPSPGASSSGGASATKVPAVVPPGTGEAASSPPVSSMEPSEPASESYFPTSGVTETPSVEGSPSPSPFPSIEPSPSPSPSIAPSEAPSANPTSS